MIDESIVLAYRTFFKGRTDVWGSVEGNCNKTEITDKNYRLHLEGKVSMGCYMLQDDGTTNFFAVDLDDPIAKKSGGKQVDPATWDKAIKIRNVFTEIGLAMYIAESKSRGYHVYGFGSVPLPAPLVRQVSAHVLEKLGIMAEIFPKQDKLDPKTLPYGNYINLPYFGDKRMFVKQADHSFVELSEALAKIQRITPEDLAKTLKSLPKLKKDAPATTRKTPDKATKKHPPCVIELLKGVGQGVRDKAAFALARHYLDQGYTVDETINLLELWDAKNTPPFNDPNLLEDKVRSAEKGYAFGCATINAESAFAGYCPGKDKCEWMQVSTKEKLKKGLIEEKSAYEDENFIYEEIVTDLKMRKRCFVRFDKKTQEMVTVEEISLPDGRSIIPIWAPEIEQGVVQFPSGVEEYGSPKALLKEIKDFILIYVDVDERDYDFASWYIVSTWIYDRLNTISYFRFLGDSGTGKSQGLNTVAQLCYKPMMMAGSVTQAPIYRIIAKYKGTLIMDESDLKETDTTSEVVKIFNCGFQRGRSVVRCDKDTPGNMDVMEVFCPKVFAARYKFDDIALESRCFTLTMEESDREEIPEADGRIFNGKLMTLRNKLLLLRLRTLQTIDSEDIASLNLGKLEPRLKQIARSFILPFKDDPDIMEEFKDIMQVYQRELLAERVDSTQGRIIHAIFKAASISGREYISPAAISKILTEEMKLDITAQTLGKILTSLKIKRKFRRGSGQSAHYLIWDNKIMGKHLRRYFLPEDKTDYLFLTEREIAQDGTELFCENGEKLPPENIPENGPDLEV